VAHRPDRAASGEGQGAAASFFTVGHSTRTRDEFIALLEEFAIDLVADVRAFPRSRTNPQFDAEPLSKGLAQASIAYCHFRALGGRRHSMKGAAESPNDFWRNESFRNYADYASTDAFRAGLDDLRVRARGRRCAVMCAETVWWRCHRRIIADYVLAAGTPVTHILGSNKSEPATLTSGAEALPDGTLVYRQRNSD
jgi:uncharacterized protein (DUF488 family)